MSGDRPLSEEQMPPGVVAVFISDGRVVAHAAEFNRSTYGGFTLRESQEVRARASLAHAVVRECCSRLISDNLGTYECEQLLARLPGKTHLIQIGHGDKDGQ